ncbi:MAG: LytTR family DNA-binding domain-containing protein [Bacteroidota bacterium]
MKVVIIEDEKPAAERLKRYLLKYDPAIEVMGQLTSVHQSVAWLEVHQEEVDLLFMDIQLTDGISFEIFQEIGVRKPVIFTTAYDEYAIDAFRVNSIDYLLKPITFTMLAQAMKKLNALKEQFASGDHVAPIIRHLHAERSYKHRFLVRLGNRIQAIPIEEIALFFAEGRTVFLLTRKNKKFILEYRLQELEELLDPTQFFRVNRTFVIPVHGIQEVLVYSNSRLKILPSAQTDKEIIVSRDKVQAFKEWLAGET